MFIPGKTKEGQLKRSLSPYLGHKLAIESQYLLVQIYEHQEEEIKQQQALNKLYVILTDYLEKTKDLENLKIYADYLYKYKQQDMAEKIYTRCLSYLSKGKEVRNIAKIKRYAEKYFSTKKYSLSKKFYLKYIELISQDRIQIQKEGKKLVEKYHKIARSYEANAKNYNRAKDIYKDLLDICQYLISIDNMCSERDYLEYKMALCLKGVGEWESAQVVLLRLMRKATGHIKEKITRELITVYFTSGDNKKIERLKNLIKFSSQKNLPEIYFYIARANFERKNYKKAKKNFRKILQEYQESHMSILAEQYLIVIEEKLIDEK